MTAEDGRLSDEKTDDTIESDYCMLSEARGRDDYYAHSAIEERDQAATMMNQTAQEATGPIIMTESAATQEVMDRIEAEINENNTGTKSGGNSEQEKQ